MGAQRVLFKVFSRMNFFSLGLKTGDWLVGAGGVGVGDLS